MQDLLPGNRGPQIAGSGDGGSISDGDAGDCGGD
jgi:hypothetical protein